MNSEGSGEDGAARRKRSGILFAIVFFVLVLGSLAISRSHREPTYGGQALSQWLAHTSIVQVYSFAGPTGPASFTNTFVRFVNAPGVSAGRFGTNSSIHLPLRLDGGSLTEAMKGMGDDAIPILLSWLKTPDSPIKTRLNSLLDRQAWFKFRFEEAYLARMKGLIGFRELGTNGNSAVPALAQLANREPHTLIACQSLSSIGTPDANAAIRSVLANNVGNVRTLAGQGVGISIPISNEPMNLLEIYTLALYPSNRIGHLSAIRALGAIGEPPEVIVPLLIPCLTTQYGSEERLAALREIGESGADLKRYLPEMRAAIGEDPGAPNSYQDDLHKSLERLLAKHRM